MGGCNTEGESKADGKEDGRGREEEREGGREREREGVGEIDQSSLCTLRLTAPLRDNVTEEEESGGFILSP